LTFSTRRPISFSLGMVSIPFSASLSIAGMTLALQLGFLAGRRSLVIALFVSNVGRSGIR
jgi:hypothetical protein